MSGKMVGVDLGASMVRVVEVAGVDSDGFAVISRVGLSPMPDGAIHGGRVRNPKEVSVALVKALRDAGVPRQGFVLGLTSPDAALTTMAFPASVRPEERETAIMALGRPISPTFTLEDSALATYLVGTGGEDADGTAMRTIGVAAVLNEDLDALRQVCDLARCSPRAVDLSGSALLRALMRVNPMAGEIGTVVDIGAGKVTVATRQGMLLRSLRTTVGGGADITRAIASALRVEFDEAEEEKMSMRLAQQSGARASVTSIYGADDARSDGTSLSQADIALGSSVDMLVDTIAQSVETDAANHGSMTQGVSLCGGTSLIRGLKDRLQLRLGLPVAIGRPWADLERSKRNAPYFVSGRPDPKLLLMLSTAVGLALWKEPL